MKFDNFQVVNPQIVPADRKRELDRRYLAFVYPNRDARGGLEDLVATSDSYDDILAAVNEARKTEFQAIWHVYDSATGQIVLKGSDP